MPTREENTVAETLNTDRREEKREKKRALLLARRSAREVGSGKLVAKGALLTALGLVLLMAILFAASALLSFEGAFTIRTLNPQYQKKAISLSETEGFANPMVELSAKPIDDMDNITYEWLPFDELDARDGSHNGENYIAYTYYIRNSGEEALDYLAELNITKCTRDIDEAVRVMVYRNGEPTIYAHRAANGETEVYPENIQNFYGDTQVLQETHTGVEPGETDRYTVVVWLEGEDPECVDIVRSGVMRLEMDFTILTDEPAETGAAE